MKHSTTRVFWAGAQAVAYLAVTGCGGGGDDASTSMSAQPPGPLDSEDQTRQHALAASPNGTTLTQWSGGSLTDSSGNVWRLNGPGTSVGAGVTLNNVYCGQGAKLLTMNNGLIWAQHRAKLSGR